MAPQYDITAEARRVLEEKAKRRLVLREEFLRKVSDPHRHGTGEGGTVFDPAIQRFMAMRVSTYEHFKPNAKNALLGFALVFGPIIGYSFLLKSSRDRIETRIRNGEVPYSERRFKFI